MPTAASAQPYQQYYEYQMPHVNFGDFWSLDGGYVQTMGWTAPPPPLGAYYLDDNTDVVSAWQFTIRYAPPVFFTAVRPALVAEGPFYWTFSSSDYPNAGTSFTSDDTILAGPQGLTFNPGASLTMWDDGASLTFSNDQFSVGLTLPSSLPGSPVEPPAFTPQNLPQTGGNSNLNPVPEPTSLAMLLGAGGLGIVGWWWKRRGKKGDSHQI